MKKNIVVIGGGSGVAAILRGIKHIEKLNISAIITVTDDGGSTGRLKSRYNIPAVGDIRNVLSALAESESLVSFLMEYRFHGDSSISDDISGHSLGNLILAALTKSTGSIMEAIGQVGSVLKIKGQIIPSTLEVIDLYARMRDGTIVKGESNIPKFNNEIIDLFITKEANATKEAIVAINEADYILLGIGSLYTSLIPNFLVNGISDAIVNNTNAKVLYLCNIMTEPGETDNYDVDDHIRVIERYLKKHIDYLIYPDNVIPNEILEEYKSAKSDLVVLNKNKKRSCQVIEADLLTFENNQARHDYQKVKRLLEERLI